ncbi:MAG: hypothetical protein RLZZ179_3133 [Verrucomicrobiota bacterium]|jgi:hypothetical protein
MAFQLRHFFRRESGLAVLPSAGGEVAQQSRETVAGSSAVAPRGTATVRELRRLIPAGDAATEETGGDSLVLLPMSAVASGRMRLRELWECAPFLFRGEVAVVDAREVVLGEEPAGALEQPERTGGLWSRFAELGEPLAAAALQVPPGGIPEGSQNSAGRDRVREQKPAEMAGPREVAALLGTLPGVRACALSVAGAGAGAGGDAEISCALRSALPQTEAAYRILAAGMALTDAAVVTMRAGEEVRTVIRGNGVFLVVAHAWPELPEQTAAQCLAVVRRLASTG